MDYDSNPKYLAILFFRLDTCLNRSLSLLKDYKTLIPQQLNDLLKIDIRLRDADGKVRFMYSRANKFLDSATNPYAEEYARYKKRFSYSFEYPERDSTTFLLSYIFWDYIIYKYKVDSCLSRHRRFNVHDCYLYENSTFSGAVRDNLVTSLLWEGKQAPGFVADDITNSLTYVKNPDFRELLKRINSRNTTGAIAPNFTLENKDNKLVNLKQFKGKVVILDFWFTGCGACRDLAPILFKLEEKFQNQNVVFVSISIDKDKNRWLGSLKENLYSSPLSTNLYTGGKGDLHPIITHYDVSGFPTLILIDKNGDLGPNPKDPRTDNGKDLIEKIEKTLNN